MSKARYHVHVMVICGGEICGWCWAKFSFYLLKHCIGFVVPVISASEFCSEKQEEPTNATRSRISGVCQTLEALILHRAEVTS